MFLAGLFSGTIYLAVWVFGPLLILIYCFFLCLVKGHWDEFIAILITVVGWYAFWYILLNVIL